MFGGIGWIAQGGDGTLLVFLLGGGFVFAAVCLVAIRFFRPH